MRAKSDNPIDVGTKNEVTRVQWLEKTLRKVPKGSKILDAGAGEQQFKKFCKHLDYVSQDIAQYDGQGNQKGLQTETWDFEGLDIVSDIIDIPRPAKSFDAILCTEVFEHIPNPVLAVQEFSRLLKPGGQLIITAPFCSITHFAPEYFSNGFSRYWYEKNLGDAGFDIKEISANGNYFEYVAQEIRRISYIAGQYTDKKTSKLDELASNRLLATLQQLTDNDKGSSELLHFGHHVVATRNNRK